MCFAGLYGMLSFSESQIVNSISVIESGDHVGKLLINIGVSAFASKNIIASVRDVQSVMQLENDNIGEEDGDGNIIKVDKYYDESTGKLVEQETIFSLPGDAYRNKVYLDWILSDKSEEETLVDDYQDLIHQLHSKNSKNGLISTLDLLSAKAKANIIADQDKVIAAQIKLNNNDVDDNLRKLQEKFGAEYLKSLSDKELYNLYKKFAVGGQA